MKKTAIQRAAAALAFLLVPAMSLRAAVPAPFNAGQLPNLAVWDENNTQLRLGDALRAAGSGPVLVLPLYTRCTMSCPVLTRMLVQQTSRIGEPYRVLLFSFDPGDDAAALRSFRAQKALPRSWLLFRSDAADIRRFCDFFHYTIMTEGPVMIHTNQMFLLDRNLRWRATFVDQNWDAAELRTWMRRAESPGLLGWLAMNPDLLILTGFAGVLSSLLLVLLALVLRSRTSRSRTAPGELSH